MNSAEPPTSKVSNLSRSPAMSSGRSPAMSSGRSPAMSSGHSPVMSGGRSPAMSSSRSRVTSPKRGRLLHPKYFKKVLIYLRGKLRIGRRESDPASSRTASDQNQDVPQSERIHKKKLRGRIYKIFRGRGKGSDNLMLEPPSNVKPAEALAKSAPASTIAEEKIEQSSAEGEGGVFKPEIEVTSVYRGRFKVLPKNDDSERMPLAETAASLPRVQETVDFETMPTYGDRGFEIPREWNDLVNKGHLYIENDAVSDKKVIWELHIVGAKEPILKTRDARKVASMQESVNKCNLTLNECSDGLKYDFNNDTIEFRRNFVLPAGVDDIEYHIRALCNSLVLRCEPFLIGPKSYIISNKELEENIKEILMKVDIMIGGTGKSCPHLSESRVTLLRYVVAEILKHCDCALLFLGNCEEDTEMVHRSPVLPKGAQGYNYNMMALCSSVYVTVPYKKSFEEEEIRLNAGRNSEYGKEVIPRAALVPNKINCDGEKTGVRDLDEDKLYLKAKKENDVPRKPPPVSNKKPISELRYEYENGISYMQLLKNRYSYFRQVAGDGSCFYRSFITAYLEYVWEAKDLAEVSRVKESAQNCLLSLTNLGYDITEIQVFFDAFYNTLDVLVENDAIRSSSDLLNILQNKEVSDNMVMMSRWATSADILTRLQYYEPFLDEVEDMQTAKQYCEKAIRMNEYAENVHGAALSNGLGISFVVSSLLDTIKQGTTLSDLEITPCDAEEPRFLFRLLYRPEHYDIVYL